MSDSSFDNPLGGISNPFTNQAQRATTPSSEEEDEDAKLAKLLAEIEQVQATQSSAILDCSDDSDSEPEQSKFTPVPPASSSTRSFTRTTEQSNKEGTTDRTPPSSPGITKEGSSKQLSQTEEVQAAKQGSTPTPALDEEASNTSPPSRQRVRQQGSMRSQQRQSDNGGGPPIPPTVEFNNSNSGGIKQDLTQAKISTRFAMPASNSVKHLEATSGSVQLITSNKGHNVEGQQENDDHSKAVTHSTGNFSGQQKQEDKTTQEAEGTTSGGHKQLAKEGYEEDQPEIDEDDNPDPVPVQPQNVADMQEEEEQEVGISDLNDKAIEKGDIGSGCSVLWCKIPKTMCRPCKREKHCAVLYKKNMYMFGGYQQYPSQKDKSLDSTLWAWNCENQTWKKINGFGQRPQPNTGLYGHTMCLHANRLVICGGVGNIILPSAQQSALLAATKEVTKSVSLGISSSLPSYSDMSSTSSNGDNKGGNWPPPQPPTTGGNASVPSPVRHQYFPPTSALKTPSPPQQRQQQQSKHRWITEVFTLHLDSKHWKVHTPYEFERVPDDNEQSGNSSDEGEDDVQYPLKIKFHTSVVHNDFMYIFGGITNKGHTRKMKTLDLATMKWSNKRGSKANMKNPPELHGICHHTAVNDGNRMIVFGGMNSDRDPLNDVWLYSFETGNWSNPDVSGVIPGVRYGHSAAWYNNQMLVFGGCTAHMKFDMSLFCLDIGHNSLRWRLISVGGLVMGRQFHSSTLYHTDDNKDQQSNKLIVFGGGRQTTPDDYSQHFYCNTNDLYEFVFNEDNSTHKHSPAKHHVQAIFSKYNSPVSSRLYNAQRPTSTHWEQQHRSTTEGNTTNTTATTGNTTPFDKYKSQYRVPMKFVKANSSWGVTGLFGNPLPVKRRNANNNNDNNSGHTVHYIDGTVFNDTQLNKTQVQDLVRRLADENVQETSRKKEALRQKYCEKSKSKKLKAHELPRYVERMYTEPVTQHKSRTNQLRGKYLKPGANVKKSTMASIEQSFQRLQEDVELQKQKIEAVQKKYLSRPDSHAFKTVVAMNESTKRLYDEQKEHTQEINEELKEKYLPPQVFPKISETEWQHVISRLYYATDTKHHNEDTWDKNDLEAPITPHRYHPRQNFC